MNWQGIHIKWKRAIRWFFYIFSFLLVASFLALQSSVVQRFLFSRITDRWTKISKFKIEVAHIHWTWFDQLYIEGFKIIDPEDHVMIEAKSMRLNYQLKYLWKKGDPHLDGIKLTQPTLFLTRIYDSARQNDDWNISVFARQIANRKSSEPSTKPSSRLFIDNIELINGTFRYDDQHQDSIYNGFDYYHFTLDIERLKASRFAVISDSVKMQVKSLTLCDRNTQLKIHDAQAHFMISSSAMKYTNTYINIGKSTLQDSFSFSYQGLRQLTHFNDSVDMDFQLHKTILHPDDLRHFTYSKNNLIDQTIQISGTLKGRVKKFSIQDALCQIGRSSFSGKFRFEGLPNINDTFLNIAVNESTIVIKDISHLLPDQLHRQLASLEFVNIDGRFTGYMNDFVAKTKCTSSLGTIQTNVNIKVHEDDISQSSYSGELILKSFDLGKILNDTSIFQKITMKGDIRGTGLSIENANFFLQATMASVGIQHYNYTDITVGAHFASQFFDGEIQINDPNVKMEGKGSIDLRFKDYKRIIFQSKIYQALLHQIGFTKKDFSIQSNIDVDMSLTSLHDIKGTVRLIDTEIQHQNRHLALDTTLLIASTNEDNLSSLHISNSLADILLTGNFRHTNLMQDTYRVIQELSMQVQNQQNKITRWYQNKQATTYHYKSQLHITIHDLNPFFTLIGSSLYLSPHTTILGQIQMDHSYDISAQTIVKTIRYQKKEFLHNTISLSLSKANRNTDILSVLTLQSEQQNISTHTNWKDLLTEVIWDHRHVQVSISASNQSQTANNFFIQSEIDFYPSHTRIHIPQSTFWVSNRQWTINTKNEILIYQNQKEWIFKNIEMKHQKESLSLVGKITPYDETSTLKLNINQLDLSIINSFSTEKISGIMNGYIHVKDYYKNPSVQSEIKIEDLYINQLSLGNLTGLSLWNEENKQFDISIHLEHLKKKVLQIDGHYTTSDNEPLQLKVYLNNIDIKMIKPFYDPVLDQLDGKLSGQLTVTGSLQKPLIHGYSTIKNGHIKINYTNTEYTFSGQINILPNSIVCNQIHIKDVFNQKATLSGTITHDNFSSFRPVLTVHFSNLQLLNTTASGNSLFYGESYGSGYITMTGALNDLNITSTITTNKKTRISILLNQSNFSSITNSENFIHFKSTHDSTTTTEEKKEADLPASYPSSRIRLSCNLNITPDAYSEIIFNAKSGDIIRGYGKGNLKLQMGDHEKFYILGTYEFEESRYNFTLYNIINKEFRIAEKSKIIWSGDPYQGILDIQASYSQLTSLTPILGYLTQEDIKSFQVQQRYPVDVAMTITGPMLYPKINFDLVARELPKNSITLPSGKSLNLPFEFNAFKSKIDEQELKRQIFSLIILRRFSPTGSFITNESGQSIVGSLSELLSNQLSYWLSQMDENLEIDVDLGKLNKEQTNTYQLRLSYSLLNGRLHVSRNSSFSFQKQNTEASLTNLLLGEWTIDYFLTPDGKYKIKMFNRTNLNQLNTSVGNQSAIIPGVSFSQSNTFNKWGDLLLTTRRRNKKQKKEDQNISFK